MSHNMHVSPWMDDGLRVFRKTVHRFVTEELAPRQHHWREQRRPDAASWARAGQLGLLLNDVPEEYGGRGGSFANEAILLEELSRAGISFGANVHNAVAHYILAYGTENQKRTWLPRMAEGELVGAIAITESSGGSDWQAMKTHAHREGDDYVISGSKLFITNGATAGIICLAVVCTGGLQRCAARKPISLIIVETDALPGFTVGPPLHKIGMHGIDTCELFFDAARVAASNLLGGVEGEGVSQMTRQLLRERLSVAVSSVAAAEEALAITTRHVKSRIAFGGPLLALQSTRFRLAECYTEARIARTFLDQCIAQFLDGTLDSVTAAMAKYWLTDCQWRIVDDCVQLHGGYGYMSDSQIGRLWADSRVQRIYAGANEVMKEFIGSSL